MAVAAVLASTAEGFAPTLRAPGIPSLSKASPVLLCFRWPRTCAYVCESEPASRSVPVLVPVLVCMRTEERHPSSRLLTRCSLQVCVQAPRVRSVIAPKMGYFDDLAKQEKDKCERHSFTSTHTHTYTHTERERERERDIWREIERERTDQLSTVYACGRVDVCMCTHCTHVHRASLDGKGNVIMPDSAYTGFVDAKDGFDGGDGQVLHVCVSVCVWWGVFCLYRGCRWTYAFIIVCIHLRLDVSNEWKSIYIVYDTWKARVCIHLRGSLALLTVCVCAYVYVYLCRVCVCVSVCACACVPGLRGE
jgi:hypothetical protein